MTATVAEITRITKTLPPRKASQVLKLARQLAGKSTRSRREPKEVDGDAEWERIINDPRPRPKLEKKIHEVEKLIAEGKDEPFDFSRL